MRISASPTMGDSIAGLKEGPPSTMNDHRAGRSADDGCYPRDIWQQPRQGYLNNGFEDIDNGGGEVAFTDCFVEEEATLQVLILVHDQETQGTKRRRVSGIWSS